MAGVSDKCRYNKKFLDAVAFCFKPCSLAFSPKSEQLEVFYAAVTRKDVFVKAATGFGKALCGGVITSQENRVVNHRF